MYNYEENVDYLCKGGYAFAVSVNWLVGWFDKKNAEQISTKL